MSGLESLRLKLTEPPFAFVVNFFTTRNTKKHNQSLRCDPLRPACRATSGRADFEPRGMHPRKAAA